MAVQCTIVKFLFQQETVKEMVELLDEITEEEQIQAQEVGITTTILEDLTEDVIQAEDVDVSWYSHKHCSNSQQ